MFRDVCLRRTICARPPFGGHSGGRTSWRDSAASVPVEPLAPVRQSATAARGLAGRRRRGVQLQPDLWAGYDGGRAGSVGAAKLPVPGHKDLPRRFFRATAKPIGQAWQLAAGGDLSLPEIQGTPPLSTRLLNGYMDRLLTAAEYDTAAFEQFLKVAWLVDAPIRLLRPSMMWRAASANQRRQKRPTPVTATSP